MIKTTLKIGLLTGFLVGWLVSCIPGENAEPPTFNRLAPILASPTHPDNSASPASTATETATPSLFSSPTVTVPTIADTMSAFTSTVTSPIDLAFVGDIMLGRSIGTRIQNGGADQVFASVQSILQSADVAVGNLESAIGDTGTPAKKAYTFRGPPESAEVLQTAGFDVLALANNHILDYGTEAFSQTLDLLNRDSIDTIGAGINESRARWPARFTIHGKRIAFLNYVDVPVEYNGFDVRDWIAGPHQPGVSWAYRDWITQDIRQVQATSDFIVVLLHFGIEGSSTASADQKDLAHFVIDMGADLVIGAHTHMVQPIEQYQGGVIAYSLGNFVFDGFYGSYNRSVILMVQLGDDNSLEYRTIPVNIINGIPELEASVQ